MKKQSQLGKFLTKKGESAIFIILMVANIIIFVLLPIIGLTFEKSIQRIAVQDIGDTLELAVYETYQHLDILSLSQGHINPNNVLLDTLNQKLLNTYKNPQIESVFVRDLVFEESDAFELHCNIEITMSPTLYREYFTFNNARSFPYVIQLPLDKKVD